jgi:predicted small lipoprotein YifL
MKTLFNTFALVALIASLNSCGLFESNKPEGDSETTTEVPIDSASRNLDTLTAEIPATDSGITKEEPKVEEKH